MTVELLPFYMTAQRQGSKAAWTGENERIEGLIKNGSEWGAVNVPQSVKACLGRFRWKLGGLIPRRLWLNALGQRGCGPCGGTEPGAGRFRREGG